MTVTARPVVVSNRQILVVDASEKQTVKPHFAGQQGRLGRGMAKRVQLPPNGHQTIGPKSFLEKTVPERRLVNHVDVMRGRFVVHAPTTVDKIQLARSDQGLGLFF